MAFQLNNFNTLEWYVNLVFKEIHSKLIYLSMHKFLIKILSSNKKMIINFLILKEKINNAFEEDWQFISSLSKTSFV